MAKSKGVRIGITIECQTSEGVYRYRTTKNRRNTPDRLELKNTVLYRKNTKFLKK